MLEAGGPRTRRARSYVQHLERLARQYYDFRSSTSAEHEKDPDFLVDFSDHLSAKGWLITTRRSTISSTGVFPAV